MATDESKTTEVSGEVKALILVGGFGTRLRPLTFTKPKPLVEFCNKPILQHQIEALHRVGVKQIVLAISYKPDFMLSFIEEIKTKLDIDIICSHEKEPMGTAGPLALAREHLETAESFFVFNSDVTCDYPLLELLTFHRKHGHEGTIVVTEVAEPSKYGVVVYAEDGEISHFVEKPKTFISCDINAGLYCFNSKILDRIEMRPTSIEKEIFTQMTKAKELYCTRSLKYWMDIGQPRDYLQGVRLHLQYLRETSPDQLWDGPGVRGNVLVHETAEIGEGAIIGPDTVIGPHCVVGPGARVTGATLLAHSRAEPHCLVKDSIVGWHSVVGSWCHVTDVSVLSEKVEIAPEVALIGAIILPNKSIRASITKAGTIVM